VEEMKTAEQKASTFIDGFKGQDGVQGNPFSDQLEVNLLAGIRRLLKEQDRDTRHACAQAVNNIGDEAQCAHSACMNVKAV